MTIVTTSSSIHLRSSKDWDLWIKSIKARAGQHDLWPYVDPANANPPQLTDTPEPDPRTFVPDNAIPVTPSDNEAGEGHTPEQIRETRRALLTHNQALALLRGDSGALTLYQLAYSQYNAKHKDYILRKRALMGLDELIINTTTTYAPILRRLEDPHARLCALKRHVAPSSQVLQLEARRNYHHVRTQAKSTKLDEWLKEWECALNEALAYDLPEAKDINPVYDFLDAVETIDPLFCNRWRARISETTLEAELSEAAKQLPSGYKIAQLFKEEQQLQKKSRAVSKGSFATASSETFQGKEPPKKRCAIGHSSHTSEECYTLNPSLRKPGFKIKAKAAKYIIKALERQPELAKKYASIIDECKAIQSADTDTDKDESVGCAHVGQSSGNFARTQYSLHDSVILDTGSAVHITNNRSRLFDFKERDAHEWIYAGTEHSPITGSGSMKINVTTPHGKRTFLLRDVMYIPDFHTNVVSHKKLKAHGYTWNGATQAVSKDGKPVFYTFEKDDQYVIEYNEPRPTAAFTANVRQADAMKWHLRLGHANAEVVKRVLTQLYGKVVKDLSFNCEACAQCKATRQISRKSSNRMASRPLWRIHIDLFSLEESITGETVALVIRDEYSGMIWVRALPDRHQETVLKALTDFARLAERQWNLTIVVVRRDNDPALKSQYKAWVAAEGIRDEPSPIYTKEPNGAAERSGGVIKTQSGTMQEAAKLPGFLWPYTWGAACYIHNKSPREANRWKSPIEVFNNWLREHDRDIAELVDQPDLSNLLAYGCKAYPLRKEVLAGEERVLQKTRPRAHIGYLVGYDASNIYFIWVPSLSKVIRTRDVTFNEDEFYTPGEKASPEVQEDLREQVQSMVIDSDEESEAESTIWVGGRPSSPTGSDAPESEPDTASDTPEPEPDVTPDAAECDPDLDAEPQPGDYTPYSYPTPEQSQRDATPEQSQRDPTPVEEPEPTTQRTSGRIKIPSRKARENAAQATRAAFVVGSVNRIHRRNLPAEPQNWKALQKHPYKREFVQAAQQEWQAVRDMGTVQLIPREQATSKPLPLTWVFKYKFDKHGFLTKFKARICVRGDQQPLSDKETYAATLASKSFRILIALAARWDLTLRQLDAVNAFQNSPLDEEVFVELPDGFKQGGLVARLLRALYGLRRSPLLWQKLLSQVLKEQGLEPTTEEPCLFITSWLTVFFFVDDIVAMHADEDAEKVDDFVRRLEESFKIRDLGELRWFLGIRVIRDRPSRRIWLVQDSYIENIATRFGLDNLGGKGPHVPYDNSIASCLRPFEGTATAATIHLFQRKVGSLMYAAIITRPDVSWITSKLAQFLKNPSPQHCEAANRVIQYLYATRHLGLAFDGNTGPPEPLEVYTDASFADDTIDRKSTQGFLMKLYGGPVAWKSGKQDTVTTSSTEAELLALTATGKEGMATVRFFVGIRLDLGRVLTIKCDNRQTIRLVSTDIPRLQTALRHVDIHTCWARQEVQRQAFKVEYLQTTEMVADGLTKALPKYKFQRFVQQLGLQAGPAQVE